MRRERVRGTALQKGRVESKTASGSGRSGAADLPDRRVNVERRVGGAKCSAAPLSQHHCRLARLDLQPEISCRGVHCVLEIEARLSRPHAHLQPHVTEAATGRGTVAFACSRGCNRTGAVAVRNSGCGRMRWRL